MPRLHNLSISLGNLYARKPWPQSLPSSLTSLKLEVEEPNEEGRLSTVELRSMLPNLTKLQSLTLENFLPITANWVFADNSPLLLGQLRLIALRDNVATCCAFLKNVSLPSTCNIDIRTPYFTNMFVTDTHVHDLLSVVKRHNMMVGRRGQNSSLVPTIYIRESSGSIWFKEYWTHARYIPVLCRQLAG